jgi:5-formyltetrahydrofolate cyclo-ligase
VYSKTELRQSLREQLERMTPDQYQLWNSQIEQHFFRLERVCQAQKIMIYYSVRHEVMTIGMIQRLLGLGKTVALPICTPERDLKAGLITSLDQLVPARFGLKEPPPEVPVMPPEALDLVVVPGLAFDRSGNRLGHGAGYYDRFLMRAGSVYRLGLAYAFQVVSELPAEPHDQPLNGILTPDGLVLIDRCDQVY